MPRSTLRASTLGVVRLDAGTRDAMWGLYSRYYEGVERATFERDLAAKEQVILVHDRAGGVQGFSTLAWQRGRHQGRTYVALYSGDTVLERAHWGDGTLQRAFGKALIGTKLRHPFASTYWFLISKGYKTYLLLARNFPEHWPRPGTAMPAWETSLLDHLARERFGAAWRPDLGVIRLVHDGRLRSGVAPAEGRTLLDPAVAFFVAANPGHAAGDELACLGRVRAWLPARYALRRHRRT